jgi:hypothetical protein
MDLSNSSVYHELTKKTDVNWCVSFENIGDEFEFVRHGAKWEQLLINLNVIKTNPGHQFMFKPTYNLLCATRMHNLYELSAELNMPIFWQTLIHPMQLCVANMPKSVIETCINHLTEFMQSDLWIQYKENHPSQPDLNFFDSVIRELQDKLNDPNHNSDETVTEFRRWVKEYQTKYAADVKKFNELWPEFNELLGDKK